MASGAVLANGTTHKSGPLSQISEYERIVHLHDNILAGTHPRLKVPDHLRAKPSPRPVQPPSSANRPIAERDKPFPPRISSPGLSWQAPKPQPPRDAPPTSFVPHGAATKSAASSIDPSLLETSDVVVKAELKLHRQKIERILEKRLEQRKAEQRKGDGWQNMPDLEAVPGFNVSDVLDKALLLVPHVTLEDRNANNPASDSFDENSFYSSQQNESSQGDGDEIIDKPTQDQFQPLQTDHTLSRANPPEKSQEEANGSSLAWPEASPPDVLITQETVKAVAAAESRQDRERDHPRVPSRHEGISAHGRGPLIARVSPSSGNDSSSNGSRREHLSNNDRRLTRADARKPSGYGQATEPTERRDLAELTHQKRDPSFAQQLPPKEAGDVPIIHHILTPVAPQPARVSPLAFARLPALAQEHSYLDENSSRRVSPRLEQDASQQAQNTRKRRRMDTMADNPQISPKPLAESPQPYIKEEPMSPQPIPMQDIRPAKRRQPTSKAIDLEGDMARGVSSRPMLVTREAHPPSGYRYASETRSYAVPNPPPSRTISRYERSEQGLPRLATYQQPSRPYSPPTYLAQYSPGEPRVTRTVSRTTLRRPYVEDPRYVREEIVPLYNPYGRRDRSRSPVNARSNLSPPVRVPTVMAPPPLLPSRGMADEPPAPYYQAPIRRVIRQSVAPALRPGEAEPYYEQARMSAEVIRPYENIYTEQLPLRRASSNVLVERPDMQDPRGYRGTEYRGRAEEGRYPSSDMLDHRRIQDRRTVSHVEDANMAPPFVSRMHSVRPDDIRYELPPEYISRAPSTRPQAIGQDYGKGLRREVPVQSVRQYSVRPEVLPKEYMAPDPERYSYVPESRGVRQVDEVVYAERPRHIMQHVYGEEPRRVASYRY